MSEPVADNALLIMWEYDISHGREAEFAEMYGPEGEWVKLFREAPGFVRVELLIDKTDPSRAIVMDWWESRDAYQNFLREYKAEYEELNARAEMFNGSEKFLGWFTRETSPTPET